MTKKELNSKIAEIKNSNIRRFDGSQLSDLDCMKLLLAKKEADKRFRRNELITKAINKL